MKYVCWSLIGLAVLAVVVGLVLVWVYFRRKRAAERVRHESEEGKIRRLNDALSAFGFGYNRSWDCVISGMNPWQRSMGYCRQYDEAAPAMNMIMDCEPVYFRHNGKSWLLEFWKGQYGCTTGAEIGLYYNEETTERNPEKLFYTCADDSRRLHMQFSLWKDGKCILERNALHWWLTGFLPGDYSKPSELIMKVCICFPDTNMRDAFYRGLLEAGYAEEEIYVNNRSVCFAFDKPRTKQPSRYGRCYRAVVSYMNRLYCKWYRKASRPFYRTLDRISYLGFCFPYLYGKLIRLGVRCSRGKLDKYRKRQV